jgi:peptide deformylase
VPVRPVLRYPNAVLKRPASPVTGTNEDLHALAADLVDTMRAGPATVGLAAPQIGVPLRAFVLDVRGHPKASMAHGLVVLLDPELVDAGGREVAREGCLSVPDLTANVRRPAWAAVRGSGPDGEGRVYRFEGFEARAALHELDHLDGTLILDRVRSPDDLFPRRVYR